MSKIKKFRRGETTYTCECCKKLTRNTGSGEASCHLCVDCFDLGGIENSISDNGVEETLPTFANEIRAIFARRPDLVPLYGKLAKLVGQ